MFMRALKTLRCRIVNLLQQFKFHLINMTVSNPKFLILFRIPVKTNGVKLKTFTGKVTWKYVFLNEKISGHAIFSETWQVNWFISCHVILKVKKKTSCVHLPRNPNWLLRKSINFMKSNCCNWKARVTSVQRFTLWKQAAIEITCHAHSFIACSHHIYMGVILHSHPVCGELHVQHNANEEVATKLPCDMTYKPQ